MIGSIALHREFLRGLIRLADSERKQVLRLIELLSSGVITPGLRPHIIEGAKGTRFTSYSPNMDLRVLAVQSNDKQVLTYVGHHDDVYQWAKMHVVVIEEDQAYFEVLELPTSKLYSTYQDDATNTIVDSHIVDKLSNLGFPSIVSEIISSCQSDDDLLNSIAHLSPEWQEAILSIASGEKFDFNELAKQGSSRVALLTDDNDLRMALELPLDEWRIFLHPKQKQAIQHPPSKHLCILGGPGSGKSITLLHRAIWLAGKDRLHRVVLLTYNLILQQWFSNNLVKLINPVPENLVLCTNIEELINLQATKEEEKTLTSKFTHILIDEAQDLSPNDLRWLIQTRKSDPNLSLTVAYDINQAMHHIRSSELNRVVENIDRVDLNYSFRLSRENGTLIQNFGADLEKGLSENIASKMKQSRKMFDAEALPITFGYSGPMLKVMTAGNDDRLKSLCKDAMNQLTQIYGQNNIALLWITPKIHARHSDPDRHKHPLWWWLSSADFGFSAYSCLDAKGLEFFAGVIIGAETVLGNPRLALTSENFYTRSRGTTPFFQLDLNQLYVALSRFREQVVTIVKPNKRIETYLKQIAQPRGR